MDRPALGVGCAMWANRSWVGRTLPSATPVGGELAAYAGLLNAVEGNTTFYASPQPETLEKWAAAVPDGFRFMFKLPREVTHERKLRNASGVASEFLELMAPLSSAMGPVSVQLPPTFGPADLPRLDSFLADLSGLAHFAVEVRHRGFFDGAAAERDLNDLLFERRADRIVLDSRALFAGPRITPEEAEAFSSKPDLPVRAVATGPTPVVRFIGQNRAEANTRFWQPWIDVVVRWIEDGRSPLFFVHTPDNIVAPELCRAFHRQVAARLPGLGPLPEAAGVAGPSLFDDFE